MIFLLLLVFISLVIISESRWKCDNSVKYAVLITFLLVCIAAFRSPLSPDYKEYVGLYEIEHENKEIGYLALIKFSKLLSSDYILLFFISAAVSISLKVFAIRKISHLFSLSLFIYVSNIFILHDMIQMRCAISSGFLLWALYYYCNDNKRLSLLMCFTAVLFHYSAIVAFGIFLLNKDNFNKYVALISINISFFLAVFGFRFGYLWGYIAWGQIADLWNVYSNLMSSGEMDSINLFNAFFILRVVVCIILIENYDKVIALGRIYTVGLKMYVLSICAYLLFSDIPVLAFRLSELYQVVEVFLFSSLIFVFKSGSFGKLFVTVLATAFLFVNVFYNHLVL